MLHHRHSKMLLHPSQVVLCHPSDMWCALQSSLFLFGGVHLPLSPWVIAELLNDSQLNIKVLPSREHFPFLKTITKIQPATSCMISSHFQHFFSRTVLFRVHIFIRITQALLSVGALAHWVRRQTLTLEVAGSNPSYHNMYILFSPSVFVRFASANALHSG